MPYVYLRGTNIVDFIDRGDAGYSALRIATAAPDGISWMPRYPEYVPEWNRPQPEPDAPEPIAVTEEVVEVPPENCGCEAHKLMRFEDSKIRNAVVHAYSHSPRWRFKAVKNDPFPYYLGVELETDRHFFSKKKIRDMYGNVVTKKITSELSNQQASGMRNPKQLWVPKRDGSVSGPEFVSHPATMTYWYSQRKKLTEMFQNLLHAGFRSHDNDTCGMHINITREAFEDARHLFRFLTLLHNNAGWSIKMSQRTVKASSQWANVTDFKDRMYRKETARRLTQKRAYGEGFSHSASTHNRYSCFNAPAFQGRFEFRLPRGTLRIDRFYKNLEWTVAMIEYTRKSLIVTSRPKNFMAWVMEQAVTYPHLAAFLVEKKMVEQTA